MNVFVDMMTIEKKMNIKNIYKYCLLANSNEQTIKNSYPQALIMGATNKDGDFGFCCVEGNNIYIAFRGSDDNKDWMSNFDVRVNSVGLHSGFYDASQWFIHKIVDWLEQDERYKGKKITVTGQSRGGAIALVITDELIARMSKHLVKDVVCVTYGAPRPATKNSRLYERIISGKLTHIAVVNGLDIVPRTPPHLPWKEGTYVWVYTQKIEIGEKLSSIEKAKMLYQYFRKYKGARFEWTAQHHPREYEKSLENYNEVDT